MSSKAKKTKAHVDKPAPVLLPKEMLSLLEKGFEPLDKRSPNLASEVLEYVLAGTGEIVLGDLNKLKDAGEIIHLNSARFFDSEGDKQDSPHAEFLRQVDCRDVSFHVRLAHVYEACARRMRKDLMTASMFGDLAFEWLDVFLWEASNVPPGSATHKLAQQCRSIDTALVEAMLEHNGQPADSLVKALLLSNAEIQRPGFGPQGVWWLEGHLKPNIAFLPGIAESFSRHKAAVRQALQSKGKHTRTHTVLVLDKLNVPLEPFAAELVGMATAASKQVRQSIALLMQKLGEVGVPLLQEKATDGSKDERLLAVQWLREIAADGCRDFFQSRLSLEKSAEIVTILRDTVGAKKSERATPIARAIPQPIKPVEVETPLDEETRTAFRKSLQAVNDILRTKKLGGPIPDAVVEEAFRKLQTFVLGKTERKASRRPRQELIEMPEYEDRPWRPLKDFLARPELKLVHVVRLLYLTGQIHPEQEHDEWFLHEHADGVLSDFRKTHPFDLRELAAVMNAIGLDGNRLGLYRLACCRWVSPPFSTWGAEALWPYFAERLDQIDSALRATGYDAKDYQRAAFGVLAHFPQPPAKYLPMLWEKALAAKADRALAQPCLERVPDRVEKLLAALKSGKANVRTAAAEWLGRARDSAAVEPLLAALKLEKQEAVRNAFMLALEQLGVPADRFLNRESLGAAARDVAKAWPKELKWFPIGQLPRVRWADSGKTLEPAIIQWWLLNTWKSKSPEPATLLRRYCSALKPAEREELGQFILEAWMAEDLTPISRAEAEKEARSYAKAQVQWAKIMPGSSPARTLKTEAEFYSQNLPEFLKKPRGSAVAHKGILALAAACAGASAAPAMGRYLKDWYGMRAAQCRALLQALAWVEHPTAAQLLLAVGRRFRTKSIQEEANKQAQALAERKGWTVAELADRTIPTAGLDDDGVLTLDFGPRQFTARLNEDLEFALADADGKPLKSLPDPRKDEDEAKAAEAKKTFSAAKKELKSVVTMQRDRFYEAMCTQRTWPFEDWNLYLNRHPIARHHCQRLVWAFVRDEKVAALFRPLPDGSLTDASDDPVTLKPDDLVRLAHECQVTPEQSQAWRLHLKDYDVEPLFEQFGRPNFDLGEERKQEDELTDFRGHILEAFKLRGRATKLGYTRGQSQDGGWFYDYHKRFPTLGMEAVIEFTGNGLPEENRTVALTILRFERVAPPGESVIGGAKMSLGEVPSVLLSECWNDLRQIAAEGPGFDPEWEKKTQM